MRKPYIAVNARSMALYTTGMERYAREITRRLPSSVELVAPSRPTYGLQGHLWEQTVLPYRARAAGVLWSPANSGPLLCRNHVVTLHDAAVFDHPEWFSPSLSLWYRTVLRSVISSATLILTDSQFSKARILAHFDSLDDRVIVIPPGVSSEPSRVLPPQRSVYAVAYGGSNPRKNTSALFAAWPYVRECLPDVRLKVFGFSSAAYARQVEVTRPEGVDLLGYVPDSTVDSLMRNASLLIYPTQYEGFGLPPLEAMRFGVPSVVSDIPVLHEIYGDTVLYCDHNDPTSIATQAVAALSSDTLRDQVLRGSAPLLEFYTWDRTAREVFRALVKVVDG